MIDLPSMSRSIDQDGTGLMTQQWDVQNFKHKIADVANIQTGLTTQEVRDLETAFESAYTQAVQASAGPKTSEASSRFCKLNRILTTLAQRTEELKEHPSQDDPRRHEIMMVIADRKQQLNEMLAAYKPVQKPVEQKVSTEAAPLRAGGLPMPTRRTAAQTGRSRFQQ